jgi:3-isopropylmalate/(R)-2-methylmalate dehydratase small subunit
MTTRSSRIEHASGTAVPVRGDDIDTDRIIPARFLKTITFEGLEAHVFEDDRKQVAEHGAPHPFDVPAHQGAHVLVVQGNFGCGSSREHAPQAIARWGIQAIVGESFAEIFFGNSLMIGLPCVTASRADLEKLLTLAETQPTTVFDVDLASGQLRAGSLVVPIAMPDAAREALRTGNWDATGLLVDRYEEVDRTAAHLPYLNGFAG